MTFNSDFCRLFKSLEKKDDELMGCVRTGKNKYKQKQYTRMYRKPARQLCKAENDILWKYWEQKFYKKKCPRYKCEIIRMDIGWRCDDTRCQWCDYHTWRNHFIYLHKTDFVKEMNDIKKELGLESNVHKWITISPKKGSDIGSVLKQLSIVTDEYFTGDIPRTNRVMRCLELGEDGDHPHIHILAEPNSEFALKNFVRDYSKLWNRHGNKELIANKKVAFNIQTIKRPEYIRARVEYLNNETKGITHFNPHDGLIESKFGIKKYKYF